MDRSLDAEGERGGYVWVLCNQGEARAGLVRGVEVGWMWGKWTEQGRTGQGRAGQDRTVMGERESE